jgi:hypothetical protein
MILKEPGNTKVHRRCEIHIFEADYDLILSLKWRAILKHAEDRNLLTDGQYGSRAGHEAPALPYLEELKTEIAYGSRKPLMNMDNDASFCYNRIIVSLASLISRKYGQNHHVVLVNAKTLEEAQYRFKTELQVSEEAYSHCTVFSDHGTGQGSGNDELGKLQHTIVMSRLSLLINETLALAIAGGWLTVLDGRPTPAPAI